MRFAAFAALCLIPAASTFGADPPTPIRFSVSHVTLENVDGIEGDEGLAEANQKAIQRARQATKDAKNSFLLTSVVGYETTAQTGRQVPVVVGSNTIRGQVIRQTQSYSVGAVVKINTSVREGGLILELEYECSDLRQGDDTEPGVEVTEISAQTHLVMRSDEPQLVRLHGGDRTDYLLVTAQWEGELRESTVRAENASRSNEWVGRMLGSGGGAVLGGGNLGSRNAERSRSGSRSSGRSSTIERYVAAILKRYDADANGELKGDEITDRYQAADSDKDGTITEEELTEWIKGRSARN